MTNKTTVNGTSAYAWDFENRLSSVTLPSGAGQVTFKYDPFGRRIQKTIASGATNYVYDGANIVADLDGSGAILARYVQGAGIDEPLALNTSAGTEFFEADGLGSITSLSGSAGLTDTYTYKPFGITTATGTSTNRFRYTGRDWDQETGLYYYRARYYDPTTGRFISEDPLGFTAGTNFYQYADNDPVVFTDPTGKDTYVCTAPLHALGKFWGNLAYYTFPFVGVPTYHEYLCVWDGKKMVCGGQDQTGNWHGGPGQPSNDSAMERGGGCSIVNDQQCVDHCVTKAINDPNRPNYDLTNRKKKGENCQKWADDTLQSCVQQCMGKK